MKAVCLSLLICAAPCWLNGSTAARDVRELLHLRVGRLDRLLVFASVTLPVRRGRRAGCCRSAAAEARREQVDAAWLSVPGRSRLLLVLLPAVRETATRATTRTSQQPRTIHFLRAASSPRR
jgi:hypothetical protein